MVSHQPGRPSGVLGAEQQSVRTNAGVDFALCDIQADGCLAERPDRPSIRGDSV